MVRRRIAVIAPAASPISQPYSGGLAAYVATLCVQLRSRGHDVTLFAARGTDAHLDTVVIDDDLPALSADALNDVSMPSETIMREHHVYLRLMLDLAADDSRFDVIHNNSLHYLPVAMARTLRAPMVTTLHTPPTPWLESAVRLGRHCSGRFVAVSAHTASRWRPLLDSVDVVRNGVDLDAWAPGPGGSELAWSGRMVPEKAPHLAVLAARSAGLPIALAGPIADADYFRTHVAPLLGHDARYVGHLDQPALSRMVGRSAALVVTPVWDEPYGLVVAEALASGTPVAAFGRGGIPEVVDDSCARLVRGSDVNALSAAIRDATQLSRAAARERAEKHCSIETTIDEYEQLMAEAVAA